VLQVVKRADTNDWRLLDPGVTSEAAVLYPGTHELSRVLVGNIGMIALGESSPTCGHAVRNLEAHTPLDLCLKGTKEEIHSVCRMDQSTDVPAQPEAVH
jgi:hypothetical protein